MLKTIGNVLFVYNNMRSGTILSHLCSLSHLVKPLQLCSCVAVYVPDPTKNISKCIYNPSTSLRPRYLMFSILTKHRTVVRVSVGTTKFFKIWEDLCETFIYAYYNPVMRHSIAVPGVKKAKTVINNMLDW